jgi:putative hydrolase of the HAD superfamily
MSTVTTLIFDFYGVFLSDPYDAWLHRHNLTRTGDYDEFAKKLDSGAIDHEEFFALLAGRSNESLETVRAAFTDHEPLNAQLIHLIRSSLTSYSIGLISNGSQKVRTLLNEAGITDIFDQITLSSEVGMIKPQPGIFTASFEALGATAEEVIYIDDREENLFAARELGAQTIQFTSVEALEAILKDMSVI